MFNCSLATIVPTRYNLSMQNLSVMLQVASIGAGRRGRICKLAHQPGQGSHLAAVCDRREEVRNEYREQFGDDLFVTDDYRDLLAQPNLDAVFVTTPDYLHEEHALAAIESGRHVYIEKPLAITIEGCDRILAAAQGRGVMVYVGHNLRFMPMFVRMKQLLEKEVIGEVQAVWCRHFIDYGGDAYFKDWHAERQHTTGLLLQKAAHDIDVIHWFCNAYTTRTVAMGKLSVYNRVRSRRQGFFLGEVTFDRANWPPLKQKDLNPTIDVEDHSMVLMQLSNGVQASYEQCHYTPDSCRNYTVLGTEGRMENVGDESNDAFEAKIRIWNRRGDFRERGDVEIPVPMASGEHGGADALIVNDFLAALRGEAPCGARPWDARMSVATGWMATRSLRSGSAPQAVPQTPLGPFDGSCTSSRPALL